MKREYVKPMVSFDELCLDTPIAYGCSADHINDVKDMLEQGWFNAQKNCDSSYYINNDTEENNLWGNRDDSLCYYSAVIQAFTS